LVTKKNTKRSRTKNKENSSTSSSTPTFNAKPKKTEQKIPSFRRISKSFMDDKYETWTPKLEQQAVPIESLPEVNQTAINRQLTAALVLNKKTRKKGKRAKVPKLRAFMNPFLGLDYFVLQDAYNNTVCGAVVDFLSWLTVGKGMEPVLRLRNPEKHGDEEAQQKLLDANQDTIDELKRIDDTIGDSDNNNAEFEHPLNIKARGMLATALTFGKAANVRIINDGNYDLIPIHPRDMIFNIINDNWKLESIVTNLSDEPYTLDTLIYAEYNPENPIYNTLFNGHPFILRMLDQARTLRRIKGVDLKLIAKHRWSGTGYLALRKKEGTGDADDVKGKISSGEVIVAEEDDPEHDVKWHDIPIKTESNDIIEMAKYLTNDIISLAGIPTSLFFDEAAANRATLLGKIKILQTRIDGDLRAWFGGVWSKQWYRRNLEDLKGDDEAFMETFTVDCKFEDIEFESWQDRVKAMAILNTIAGGMLSDESIGELVGVDKFESMIDSDKEPTFANNMGSFGNGNNTSGKLDDEDAPDTNS